MVYSESVTAGRKDSPPLVTIAMPIYNAGHHLRLAVISIIRQSFVDWELFVIDDGSTDGAIRDIADLQDPRITIFRDGLNKGLAARLNEAIDAANGCYFARMDQDDVSYPERLIRQIEALDSHPEIDLVAVRCVAIDADDNLLGSLPYRTTHREICNTPWKGFYMVHPSWMGKTAWFRRFRYTQPGPYLCEDQDLLVRSYSTSLFATVPEVLFAYRVRNTIEWRKAFRTRKVMVSVHLRYFLLMKKWGYCPLAALVFVVRTSLDLLSTIIQKIRGRSLIGYRIRSTDEREKSKWMETRAALGSEEA